MSAHTQGRITSIDCFSSFQLTDSTGLIVAVIANPMKEADARRLAACWNHCDGIDTDTMEAGRPMLERVGLYIKEADQLRAELAAARTILAKVHAFATGAPAPVDSATCHTLAQLGERVGLFLSDGDQ